MDDLNDIKARVEGSQKWKLFRTWFEEQYPEDGQGLNIIPQGELEKKLKAHGIENVSELIQAREDFNAEQIFIASSEKKEEEKNTPEKLESEERHKHSLHSHSTTYEDFEEEAHEKAAGAADEWEKTKDPTIATNRQEAYSKAKQFHYDDFVSKNPILVKRWTETLRKKGARNEHLDNAINKYDQETAKRARKPGVRKKILSFAGAGVLAGSMLGAPRPIAQPEVYQEPTPQTQTYNQGGGQSITISLRTPGIPRRLVPRRPGGRRIAKNLGKRVLKTAAKTAEKTVARATIGALLSPILLPLLIVGFFLLLIIIVLILLLGLGFGAPAVAPPASLPEGISYVILAPPKVENGQKINYNILFYYDTSNASIPPLESLTLIDNIPSDTTFDSATGNYSYDNQELRVTWALSANSDQVKSQGNIKTYHFSITIQPENDTTIINGLCLQVGSDPPICPEILQEASEGVEAVNEPTPTTTPIPHNVPGGGQ